MSTTAPTAPTESIIPLLPCSSLPEMLEFYQALGFTITYQQESPYLYAAVQRGAIALNFASLRVYGAKNAFGAYLVFVDDIAPYHRAFADGLRAHYGKVPTAGLPRMTRFESGQRRFKVFDPTGNVVIYIQRDEPEIDYDAVTEHASPLAGARANAIFLRDTYANDPAAAKVLDLALKRNPNAEPLDRALTLALRAELAVALGELDRAQALQTELEQLPLAPAEHAQYRAELQAAAELAGWISQPTGD